jgi:hypothetical protein
MYGVITLTILVGDMCTESQTSDPTTWIIYFLEKLIDLRILAFHEFKVKFLY